MAYKVMKREFVRQRPKWLVHLLFAIPAQVYEACDTQDEVEARFQDIYKGIEEVKLFERNQKLHLKVLDDGISINSNKDRPYIKFTINNNYYKI